MQTITIDLTDQLYHSASEIARITNRSVVDVVQASLKHTLPPLDDIPAEEATYLAQFSTFDDSALWQISRSTLPLEQQEALQDLLRRQGSTGLSIEENVQLQSLLDEYGRLLLHKSHAWLLLARRGYHVPPQNN